MDPSRTGCALLVLCALAAGAARADETCPADTVPIEIPAAQDRNRTTYCEDSEQHRQGPYRWWHKNGALGGRGTHLDGKIEGWSWVWDEHSVLLSEREFRAGVEIARKRMTNEAPPRASQPSDPVHPCPPNAVVAGSPPPDGREQWCERRREDGAYVREGTALEWFLHQPGAPIRTRSAYRDGLKHGVFSTFRADGQLEQVRNYADGVRQRETTSLHPNGRKRFEAVVGADGLETQTTWTDLGVLKSEIVKSGREDRRRTYWYRNGNKKSESNWNAKKRDGLQREWWPNGALWKQGEMLNGAEVGTWQEWSPAGALMEERTITKRPGSNGREEKRERFRVWMDDPAGWNLPRVGPAPSPEWAAPPRCPYPARPFEETGPGYTARGCAIGEGKIGLGMNSLPLLNGEKPQFVGQGGELHGPVRIWDEAGTLEINFRKDEYDGHEIKWDPDGKLRRIETYRDGVRDGAFASWSPNGAPNVCGSLRGGKKQGVWLQCRESGACTKREEYRDDLKHGLWIVWWENAEVRSEHEYRDGVRDGRARETYFEGGVRTEGQYERGRRVGEWKHYWLGGKPRSAGRYAWCETAPRTSKATLANGEVVSEDGGNGCKKGLWSYWSEEGVLLGQFNHDETVPRAAATPRPPNPAAKSSY